MIAVPGDTPTKPPITTDAAPVTAEAPRTANGQAAPVTMKGGGVATGAATGALRHAVVGTGRHSRTAKVPRMFTIDSCLL